MAVSEKIELIKFNEEQYLKEGDAVYAQRAEVEAIADAIDKAGYSNIFLLGIGGTNLNSLNLII